MWRRTSISGTKMISFCGLQSPNSRIRRSNGTVRGAWDTRDGISSVPASASSIWVNIWISTAAAWTIFSASHQRDRTVRELSGTQVVRLLVSCEPLKRQVGQDEQVEGGFPYGVASAGKGYDPIVYRMFCLQSHYRKPLEFSYEVLDNMSVAYKSL